MAGHSKWKNIQHRKGAQDSKRAKIFTKIAKEIFVAVKLGGDGAEGNPRLRLALSKAKAANMPKENISRAINKALGSQDTTQYVEKTYEGYGPGGVALLVECLTDNLKRTVGDIRHALSRHAGNLGTDGSVSWMFRHRGLIIYPKDHIEDYENLFELAIDHGAEDVKEQEDYYEIICEPSVFQALRKKLEEQWDESEYAELTKIAENTVKLPAEKQRSLHKLIDILEDNDDVQSVFHNDIS